MACASECLVSGFTLNPKPAAVLQSGLQSAVLSLEGAPVALAAAEHWLAVAWHASPPSPSGDQHLRFAVSGTLNPKP
jgi:hypothetical protein